jgi:succinylglutamate desuccinylase
MAGHLLLQPQTQTAVRRNPTSHYQLMHPKAFRCGDSLSHQDINRCLLKTGDYVGQLYG